MDKLQSLIRWSWLLAALALAAGCASTDKPPATAAALPKLVVVVLVDGLPQEQLTRNHDLFVPNGFRRLMDNGAWFYDAHQAHAFTVTAIGHTSVLTGAHPYQTGIIGNEWRTRDGKYIYNTADPDHKYLDGTKTGQDDGVSPKNLKVSTLGDELRYATGNASRVFAVSGKDRGAILPGGKTGIAYMYSTQTGRFTSTSYYMKAHPDWWERYYAGKPQDQWFHQRWDPLLDAQAYTRSLPDGQSWSTSYRRLGTRMGLVYGLGEATPGPFYYSTLLAGPYGDEAMADFTIELVKNERIGQNPAGVPDLLAVSFSSHDYINHNWGPESIQSQDHLIRLDRTLARVFAAIDAQVGAENVLVVLSADHGFMNVPEFSAARGFDAGRVDPTDVRNAVNAAAEKKFGIAKVVTQTMTGGFTLDYAAIDAKGVEREVVETFVARATLEQPGIAYTYTRSQLERGDMPSHRIGLLVQRAWNRQMAVDVVVVPKPFHYFQSKTTTSPNACSHGTPYTYDTNVPLLLQGSRWVRPGRYSEYAETVDIAPTLAYVLSVRAPSASEGKVLGQALVAGR
ncbi:MAG: alkaline phosphatase family protein [Burkholderiales bacterium]